MRNLFEKIKRIVIERKWLIAIPIVLLLIIAVGMICCQKSPSAEQNTAPVTQSTAPVTQNTAPVTQSTAPTETKPQNTDNSADTHSQPVSSTASGALKVVGNMLVNQAGQPVQLRGISTHGINWFPDYVNQELFAEFRNEWKADIIRLAMYTAEYNGYCTGGNQTELKNLVKKGVEYATNAGMYAIIDWHILSDCNPNTYIDQAKEFWKEMSALYAGKDNVLYEICNEPNGGTSWADVKKYALEIIPIIRANDPDGIILVGTPNYSQYVDQAVADPITGYDNIMYTLHFYAATHKDELRSTLTNAVHAGLPIFVTEYGICDASGNGSIDTYEANKWVDTMNSLGISYVAWNISNKNETSAIFKNSCNKKSGITTDDLSDSGKWLYNMLH